MAAIDLAGWKVDLRRSLRKARASLPPAERHTASLTLLKQARKLHLLRRGRKIACYVPVGSELSCWPLILFALSHGVEVYLPQIPRYGRQMRFVRLDEAASWKMGARNIPIPCHDQICAPRDLDLVFLPLLGFDRQMGRLGQGGGFYDATFAFRRWCPWRAPKLVGVAFPNQEVASLLVEDWDLRLDLVLAGDEVIRKTKKA